MASTKIDLAGGSALTEIDPAIQRILLDSHHIYIPVLLCRKQFAITIINATPSNLQPLHEILGRGSGKKFGPSRNVDILLAAPKSKEAHGLRAAHAYLKIHQHSGAWMLTAGDEMEVENEILYPDEAVALHRPKTYIRILDMQYLIHFIIQTPEKELEYLNERNQVLQEQEILLPRTNISGIPLPGDIMLKEIVFRHGLGSGTFGNVYEGFNPDDGNLRVVKQIILQSVEEIPAVKQEIEALKRFNKCGGILGLLDWRTALNGQDLYVSQYPLNVYLVHKKGIAFNRYDWEAVSDDWSLKQSLCHQLLEGLTEIHRAGCMHRDITPQNILFFPHEKPPQAKLCDFGKFCDTSTAVETRLAAWRFLPPELEKDKSNPYGQGLDVWMLGLAIAYCWWPHTVNLRPREPRGHPEPRETADYKRMQKILWDDQQDDGLGHLIARMMAWNPRARPSAAQALTHRSLRTVATEQPPVKTSSSKRLHDER
ncbi:MAG: hypothetical protein L6R38_001957 [Xanthoria sp. 2 TBL-2021]|nr:MAG: hypothetical protein L6R38_001957 [Xanthoria sp. 2 TBL-2021]